MSIFVSYSTQALREEEHPIVFKPFFAPSTFSRVKVDDLTENPWNTLPKLPKIHTFWEISSFALFVGYNTKASSKRDHLAIFEAIFILSTLSWVKIDNLTKKIQNLCPKLIEMYALTDNYQNPCKRLGEIYVFSKRKKIPILAIFVGYSTRALSEGEHLTIFEVFLCTIQPLTTSRWMTWLKIPKTYVKIYAF